MYIIPFELGFRLPFCGLFIDFFNYYQIAPGQLMPNGWRVLMSWQVIMEIYNAPVTRKLISYHYRLQKEAGSLRYSLDLRTNHVRLVDGLSKSDKGWKDKYFVVKGEYTLGNIPTE